MSFRDTPRYQRMLQKLASIPPEQRAILNSGELDVAFEEEDMKKMLEFEKMASRKNYMEGASDLGQGKIDLQGQAQAASHDIETQTMGLKERASAFREGNINARNALQRDQIMQKGQEWDNARPLAMANLGISAGMGLGNLQAMKKADENINAQRALMAQQRAWYQSRGGV